MWAIPGRTKSSVYLAWPVIRRGSSRRLILEPKMRDAMAALCLRLHPLCGVLDRGHDVLVPGAAAQVALQPVANLRLGGSRVSREQVAAGHDHSGGAEAALQAVLLPERVLQRVKLP